jgi:tRNA G18 (ribose-2'-O)-methylase SpoU
MRSVLQQADLQLRIPYGGDFQQALDITSATAILAFEVLRQRAACLNLNE